MRNRIYLLLLVAIMASSSLMAQRGHHRSSNSLLTEEVKTKLALTAEQVAAIAQVEQETKAALEALHERTDIDHNEKFSAGHELHKGKKEKLNAILSEEQLAALSELKEAKRAAHRERMANVDHEAMRAEMREYHKTEIAPVMKAQRQQLEDKLSAEERQQLAEIRSILKASKQAAKEKRRERHAERGQDDKEARPQHGKRRGHGHHHPPGERRGGKQGRLQEKHPEEFAALSALVEKYDADITSLLEEIEPKKEEWKAAKKEIAMRYLPTETEGEFKTRRHSHHPRGGEKAILGRKIAFLLKDIDEEENNAETFSTSLEERIGVKTYPNPAGNTTTLTLDLPESADIRIDIRDEKGNLIKNITSQPFDIGNHQLTVDLSDLQSGTYYMTLNSEQFKAPKSVRLVVVK